MFMPDLENEQLHMQPNLGQSRPEQITPEQIKIYATSLGNHFMLEIAQIFYEGFKKHIQTSLVIDEIPSNQADVLQIIIAPHEFYPLFLLPKLAQQLSPQEIEAITRNSYLLNVEQPGSPWFEFAFEHCRLARGVFDINQQGVDEFVKRGITAILTPLGYAPCLETTTYNPDRDEVIDLLFLGHISPKRLGFLSSCADVFQRYRCKLILSALDKPRFADTPGFYGDEARNKLVASSQILINIHSSDRTYFEWHRALIAIANRCLFVSEPSVGFAPLVNQEHFIITDIEKIAETCEYYLAHPEERKQITDRAYEFLKTNWNTSNICLDLLEKLKSNLFNHQLQVVKEPLEIQSTIRANNNDIFTDLEKVFAQSTDKITKKINQQLTKLPGRLEKIPRSKAGLKALIKSTRHKFFGKERYSKLAHWVWQYKHAYFDLKEFRQPRRTALITRLELSNILDVMDKQPYESISNQVFIDNHRASVAVIISLFNYGEYIHECLNSVIKSDISSIPGGIEIIVVDDCSTDNSCEIVEEFLKTCPYPMQLVQKRFNTGLADVRNIGLKVANAPYIFILDADNWIYPHCLNHLYQRINNSNYAAVYGMINQFENTSKAGLGLISFLDWDENLLVRTPYIDAMAMLNREILLKVGGYSTELIQYGWFGWEDYDLWLKFAQAGYKCKLEPQILSAYRVHGNSMISTTERYTYQISKYFQSKFASLIRRQGFLDKIFGFERRFLV